MGNMHMQSKPRPPNVVFYMMAKGMELIPFEVPRSSNAELQTSTGQIG